MIKKINVRKLLTLLLSCILCVAMAIAIVPQGAMAQTATDGKLAVQEFSNSDWEIVNKDQTDVSEINEAELALTGLEFTNNGRFGGQIVSKDEHTGALTIEMDFSGTMDTTVAYTYMYVGRNSTDAISQDNWSSDGIVLGFHVKGVALYDENYTEDEGDHKVCRFESEKGAWRSVYTAGGWRSEIFSYKIVINESGVEVYSEWNTQNNDSNPVGRVALDNSDFSLTNGYIAISNRYSTYTMNNFKVNGNYTKISDWDKHGDVTMESVVIPGSVTLKDVDNVKSSTSPITENPLLVSKFAVSTDGVEADAEVFSLDLDVQTIRPRNDYFRFLIGLSENNDNPTKEINFTSNGVSDGGTCVYIFDNSSGAYVDGLSINKVTISIKGYQNGEVVVTYKCPYPACPIHTATFTDVDLNGKIGIQTITDSDAPQSQGITVSRKSDAENLFTGNVANQPVIITLTNGETVSTQTVYADSYALPSMFTAGETLIGWLDSDGALQKPGKVYNELSDMTFTAVEVDLGFALEKGASIRIDTAGETSGIRFTAIYNTDAMAEISDYVLEKGMLLVKTSAFEQGSTDAQKAAAFIYKTNLAHTFENDGIFDEVEGITKHSYAIYEIGEADYETEISARAYIKINYADGADYIYTDFTLENNSRSVKVVAQYIKDTDFYEGLDDDQKAIIDLYAGE